MTTSYFDALTTEDLTHLLRCLEDLLGSTRILREFKRELVAEEFEKRYDIAYIAELKNIRSSRFANDLNALSISIDGVKRKERIAASTTLQSATGSQAVTSVPAQSTSNHNSLDIPTEQRPRIQCKHRYFTYQGGHTKCLTCKVVLDE